MTSVPVFTLELKIKRTAPHDFSLTSHGRVSNTLRLGKDKDYVDLPFCLASYDVENYT